LTGFAIVMLASVLLAGCAVNRPTPDPAELEAIRQRYLDSARAETRLANDKMIRRLRLEADEHLAAQASGNHTPPPTFDILVLSGGGDFGAFGAGFLKGWGDDPNPALRRPEFDMVTGVSTGALIAPFAFIGDDPAFDKIVQLYSVPNAAWFRRRGPFFFLPSRASFIDNAGLREDLDRALDPAAVASIAEGSRRHRVLGVSATNLDVSAMHPFELSVEAERAQMSGDRDRMLSILMASSAIPAIFPPVIIDGALYVDGGTTGNILYGANWASPKAPPAMWKAQYPNEPMPKIRFWVIINMQLGLTAQTVQPTWIDITKASMATVIQAGTVIAMRHLSAQVKYLALDGVDVEFRYVAIPQSWRAPNARRFDAEVMQSLARLGMEMGANAASWRTDFTD